MLTAGIESTRNGWLVVSLADGAVQAAKSINLRATLADLRRSGVAAVAVDMPIGLPEAAEPGGRRCEQLARNTLGSRSSSVFNSPVRQALEAASYEEASALNRQSSPHRIGLSKQSFAMLQKLRAVDGVATPEAQEWFFETHPELGFSELWRQWGRRGALVSKSTREGLDLRVEMLGRVGIAVEPLLAKRLQFGATEKDVVDAAVAAWTASRKANGSANRIPEVPPVDARGLRMEMWF